MSERFSGRVAAALADAGWQPDRDTTGPTTEAIELTCQTLGEDGRRHTPFRAAVLALVEFGGLTVDPGDDGVDLIPRPFVFDPTLVAASVETLADVGSVLGVSLFPIGAEGDMDAILAIDERGRVFSIDHAGEWFLGETLDEAVETLVLGRNPERVRDDGTW